MLDRVRLLSTMEPSKKKKKKEKRRHAEENGEEEVQPVELASSQSQKRATKPLAKPTFDVGEEFNLETNGAPLDLAEDDSDVEVWMVQLPVGYDARQLNEQMVLLQGEQVLSRGSSATGSSTENGQDDVRHHSMATRYDDQRGSECHVLLPSEKTRGELKSAWRKIAGCMEIRRVVATESQDVEADDADLELPKAKRRALPAGLVARPNVPGADEPVQVPRKHARKAVRSWQKSRSRTRS